MQRVRITLGFASMMTGGCACSVRTRLRLQYGALQIAVGCIHVALLLLKVEPRMQNSWNWWEHLQVSADDLRGMWHPQCSLC